MNQFIYYPKCSTCLKAKKFLESNGITCSYRDIKNDPLKEAELKAAIAKSNLPIKKFFNTSGQVYKQLNLKETLNNMSEEEQIALLASDGMLVKRPLFISDDMVLVGFKEDTYKQIR